MFPSLSELLTREQVERTHQASLEILDTVGLEVNNARAREILRHHGCRIGDNSRVTLPPEVVGEFIVQVPSKFTFHARNPEFDRTVPDDAPLMMTASSAPNLIDPVSGEERRATSADIARIARLVNELPGVDLLSISVLADDAPKGHYSLTRFFTALKHCEKPVRGSGDPGIDTDAILKLAYTMAGGEEAYKRHPFITHHYCPIISPLKMDENSTELLMFYTEQGLPSQPTVVPNAGLGRRKAQARAREAGAHRDPRRARDLRGVLPLLRRGRAARELRLAQPRAGGRDVRHAALHVADRALHRVLGYPPKHTIEGMARVLLDETRAWFHEHVRPWSATVEHEVSRVEGVEVVLGGTTLRGPALARRVRRSGACIGVVVGVTLGVEVDRRIEELWAGNRPDLAFFLDGYASLAVGRLVRRVAGEVGERARRRGLSVLPHTSPGYDGWPLDDQGALFGLLAPTDRRLQLLDSGQLVPRKSLLGLIPLTAAPGPLAPEDLRTSCRACSMPDCAHRSAPMDGQAVRGGAGNTAVEAATR